jgi:hypothetical protein
MLDFLVGAEGTGETEHAQQQAAPSPRCICCFCRRTGYIPEMDPTANLASTMKDPSSGSNAT